MQNLSCSKIEISVDKWTLKAFYGKQEHGLSLDTDKITEISRSNKRTAAENVVVTNEEQVSCVHAGNKTITESRTTSIEMTSRSTDFSTDFQKS